MNFNALRYEELTLNAFPVLHTEVYDGWILRFSGGEGYQGNCISPLYLSTRAYEDKIDYCENKFREKGLPCVFKMTPNVPAALDQQLAMRQYELEDKTYIMECSLTSEDSLSSEEAQVLPSASPTGEDGAQENNILAKTEIRLSREIDDSWLEAFLTLEGMDKDICLETARAMLNAIRKPVYCAALYENETSHGSKADCGRIVGCGLGVVEDNKIGIYDIRVESSFRQNGIGARICRAIMEEGKKEGAQKAFLHVSASNRPAVRLYQGLGFEEAYTYWYRVHTV
ncbi:Acetyltransferase (GNAT) family protein [Lachnospiraceae bacterium NLAE-zl-G231]|nr:Acetyltransferase (GNAT) family protein [Lachnospiraceae bacterium NLAE-zl-G231]